MNLSLNITISDIINNHLKKFFNEDIKLKYYDQVCEDNMTLKDFNKKKLTFYIIYESSSSDDSYENECAVSENYNKMEINIKFLKVDNNWNPQNYNTDLNGLLKLCLLKEIAKKMDNEKIYKLEEKIQVIIKILKNGEIDFNTIKEGIKKVLDKG